MIDLRSDTVTKPSDQMRATMAAAPVGDDVYGEDPTVLQLQERGAELFGMEAGLFVPTGVMANQLALAVQTRPGDEVIVSSRRGTVRAAVDVTRRVAPGNVWMPLHFVEEV